MSDLLSSKDNPQYPVLYDAAALLAGWLPYGDGVVDAIDGIIGDPAVRERMEVFQRNLDLANDQICLLEDAVERFEMSSVTVSSDAGLRVEFSALVGLVANALNAARLVEINTRDSSTQSIVNSLLSAEAVRVLANDRSRNLLKKTTVRSNDTRFSATGGSVNELRDAVVGGRDSSLSFKGISQRGDVSIKDGILDLGTDSSLSFGNGWVIATESMVDLQCPSSDCGHTFSVTSTEIRKLQRLMCPRCHQSFLLRPQKAGLWPLFAALFREFWARFQSRETRPTQEEKTY